MKILFISVLVFCGSYSQAELFQPPFQWTLSDPLLSPVDRPEDPCFSVKDPTVVFHENRWHVFSTIRSVSRTHQIEYVSFDNWEQADAAPRALLQCREGYFCAPQVMYFRPHQKWYLIYQVGEPKRKLGLQPAYSTTTDLSNPTSWSKAELFFPQEDPENVKGWIDFLVICDEEKAYLFFTSLDGHFWRMWTPIREFPNGFRDCRLALEADIFEAAHVYRLPDGSGYLAVIEAQGTEGRRYYKAYTAKKLDGEWTPLADTELNPFAGAANVQQPDMAWADNISHGELIRESNDEACLVQLSPLQFLIQGVMNSQKQGKTYGEIPWRLGLLTKKE